ncbi:MAG: beta-phosphoglucomutase family hydrolase [Nitrospirota bacterium]|nr:MAG: beta-phosphoglucomutase family hydrolase [Nitrospirota bacterium]
MSGANPNNPITRDKFDAVLFDLDGVITATAKVHAKCWKKMFDEYLKKRSAEKGEPFHPFDIETDYRLYVDGKPRFNGVRDFLTSRKIHLPEGTHEDPSHVETVGGLGNRKNELINEVIESEGVEAYEGTITLARQLKDAGIKIAVVTSSQNCDVVLKAVNITDLFEAKVDGNVIHEQNLSGKPAPDSFLEGAKRLGVQPARAVVVEDAISGVQAGRNGKFGLVIGVDRKGYADELKKNGADVVVKDLGEFL